MVLAKVNPTIDTSVQYSIGFEVGTRNDEFSFSSFEQFDIDASTTLVGNPSPSFKAEIVGNNKLQIGGAIAVKVDITPSNAYADAYEFEFDLPTDYGFTFLGWSVSTEDNFEPFVVDTVTGSNDGAAVTISPTQQVDNIIITTKITGSPSLAAREAHLYATFGLLSTPAVVDNTAVDILVAARYNSDSMQWAEDPLSVLLFNCIANPNPALPALGDDLIFPWGAQAFFVAVEIPDNEVINNMLVSVNIPLDNNTGAPLFHIERTALVDYDAGVTVVVGTVITDNTNGVASVSMPTAHAQTGKPMNRFRLMFAFSTYYDYSNLVDQQIYNFAVTVTEQSVYCGETGTTTTYYGGFNVRFSLERPGDVLQPYSAPRLIWRPITSTVVKKGGTATFDVDVVLPPKFNAWTELGAFVTDIEEAYMSVAHIAPNAFFDNDDYPVYYTRNNNSMMIGYKGSYVWGHTTNLKADGPITINLGTVSVRLGLDSTITDGSIHEFALGLAMLPWRWAIEMVPITADTSKYTFLDMPATSFFKKNTETSVSLAGGAVYKVRLQTPPNSVGKYQFDFNVPQGASICSVVVVNTGINVAYVNNSDYDITTLTPDTGRTNYSWSVMVDALANSQREDSTDPNKDDEIFVEVGVCLPPQMILAGSGTSPLASGATLTVGATVTVDDSFVFSESINSTVTTAQLDSEVPAEVNMTIMGWANEVDYIYKSQYTLINISIDTTPHSNGIFKINVTFPVEAVNQQTYGIVEGMKIISTGKNIICASMISYSSVSTISTSQLNSGELEFAIANSGSWQLMPDYYDYLQAVDDNRVTIELQLRHSDHFWNIRNTARPFDVVLTYNTSNNVVEKVGYMPPLNVRGIEAPEFESSWTADAVPEDAAPGHVFYVYGTMKHSQNSSAHGYMVRLQFFKPPYVGMGTLQSSSGTQAQARLESTASTVDLVWDIFLMEEVATFNFSFVIDPTNMIGPSVNLLRVELISAVESRKLVKVLMNDQYQISGAPIPVTEDQMTLDKYGSISSRSTFTFTPPSCNANLGVSNPAVITDCMIYHSSILTKFQGRNLTQGGLPGRLGNSNEAWMPAPRGDPFFNNEYMLISIGAPATVAAMDIQGDAVDDTQAISKVQVQWSTDGARWMTYVDKDTSSSDLTVSWTAVNRTATDIATITFEPPIEGASFVRVLPKQSIVSATTPFMPLKIELRGCASSTRDQTCLTDFLVQPTPNYPNTPKEYAHRAYMWVESESLLFSCSQPSVE